MTDVLAWIAENWQMCVGTVGTVVLATSLVVKVIAPHTATKKDDKVGAVLTKIHKWLSRIALNPPVKK